MVTLEKIRADLSELLDIDNEIKSVEVRGDTIEDCLDDAAVQLDSKVVHLEYEVLSAGSNGIMGLGKKPWVLRVYQNPMYVKKKKEEKKVSAGGEVIEEEEKVIVTDGLYYIRHFGSEINLKVILPVGGGKPVNVNSVLADLNRPDTMEIDEGLVKKLCKEGSDGEYVSVGIYKHVSAGDAIFSVDISSDEMSATILVSSPGPSGAEISAENIRQKLRIQGVVAGISDEKIEQFIDNPVYNIPYEVAAAVKPQDGRDAYIDYKFETDTTKLRLEESKTGQIDFKQMNMIQNVVAGQPLAVKILPEQGKGGKTVLGRYLEAKNGKDIAIPLGQNVTLAEDGCTILAACNGEVLLQGNKISVEPVREEKGVNIKTGHIDFMGTVIVRGNVEDGFNIKADGNVEIFGTVGSCRIEAGGNVVISQGFVGRHIGEVITPKTVWAHHVENATINAGEYVIVNDSIINSEVNAKKKIVLRGKRAQISGGHLIATEEITAKTLGNTGGVETILEAGMDPESKKHIVELQTNQKQLLAELEEVDKEIAHLEEQKKVRRALPKDKEENLSNLINRKQEINDQCDELSKEISQLEIRLKDIKAVGKVNASGTVYPGVKVYVRDTLDEVKNEVRAVTFYFDDQTKLVRRGKYSANLDDIKGPDGYTSN